MNNPVTVEICVDSIESAIAADNGGAHRVELCSNLAEGGTTPSTGLVEGVRQRIGANLYVLVRPRPGDFCYSEDEFEVMKRDVLAAKRLGADGVVVGILTEDGLVDVQRTRCLVELAEPMGATFHRAFDMSPDLSIALEDVIDAGVDRILTSGGEQRAEDSIATIAKLVAAAEDRIKIMVGGGIRPTNVRRVLAETRAREIHANLGVVVASPMLYRNERIAMGTIKGREYERVVVSAESVRKLVEAAAMS
jgi:copper homeostasis protein